MRTIVAVAIAGGIAAAIALLTALFLTPVVSLGPQSHPLIPQQQQTTTITTPTGLPGYNQTVVSIGGVKLTADIADTPDKMNLGLGVRDNMTESQAMLFPFKQEGRQGFWMSGMKFPIDIIWINADKRVVHIEHSLPPCPNIVDCPVHTPDQQAMYVLETTAGFSQRHNVTEGAQVEFG
ncbi:MAG: DUF192 domain-containing protein [Nitrososphaera sp.]